MTITRWKDKIIIDYLKENYDSLIRKYKSLFLTLHPHERSQEASNLIWSIWWQGEDKAPEIVKTCFASVRRHCGKKIFNVITKNNFRDFIKLPEYIFEKVNSGTITLTHLSDILRMYLLYHYGGLWIDATVLAISDFPEEIFTAEYFSINTGFNPKSYTVRMGRWNSFFQAAHKGNALCGFALEGQIEYWRKNSIPLDYVLIDYFFALAYQEFPEIKNLIDAVPINNPKINNLQPLLNSPFNEKIFEDLTCQTKFFKLTYKHKFIKNISGRETFYGRLTNKEIFF